MKTIAYIIGYRSSFAEDRRLLNLKITIDWLIRIKLKLKAYKINLDIIIIEQDSIPKFCIDPDTLNQLEYLFVYNNGFYNRGWGFNVGYKNFIADYYFFADGDIIMNETDMVYVFKTCFTYDAVNPYKHIYDSTEEYITTAGNVELINVNNDFKNILPERVDTCFSGGIMGIGNYAMNCINGWDERFRGRGWEDYAFTAKCELFLYSIHTYPCLALHLWHPYEINTTREINEHLNSQYEQYNFYDYFNLINTYVDFGSSIKYAILTSSTTNNRVTHKKYIGDDRYYYAKDFFNKLMKKYNNDYKKVYLYLCDQLKQVKTCIAESGSAANCNEIENEVA